MLEKELQWLSDLSLNTPEISETASDYLTVIFTVTSHTKEHNTAMPSCLMLDTMAQCTVIAHLFLLFLLIVDGETYLQLQSC